MSQTAARVSSRELAEEFDLARLKPAFYLDPYPTYHARAHAPVKRMENGSWFITRYEDILPVYRDAKIFSSDKKKEFGPKFGASPLLEHHTTSLLQRPAAAHGRAPSDRRRVDAAAHRGDGAGADQAGRRAARRHGKQGRGRSARRLRGCDPDRHHRQSARDTA